MTENSDLTRFPQQKNSSFVAAKRLGENTNDYYLLNTKACVMQN
jgi:hypothetical protein